MPRALLIDDEPLARDELRRLLAVHPEVTIVGEAEEVPAARVRLAQVDYDLVLVDIQLAGGSGFDLVSHVAPSAEIIFVTAHDRFAVRAFEVNALDYLLKPVSPARLAEALRRVVTDSAVPASAKAEDAGSDFHSPFTTDDRVFLKSDRGARFVPLVEVAAVLSCDNYSEVFVVDGAHYLVRRPLKAWETALPADHFVRVHRQAIVNLSKIERITDPDGDSPALHLRGLKQPVACSHRLAPDLRRRLTDH